MTSWDTGNFSHYMGSTPCRYFVSYVTKIAGKVFESLPAKYKNSQQKLAISVFAGSPGRY